MSPLLRSALLPLLAALVPTALCAQNGDYRIDFGNSSGTSAGVTGWNDVGSTAMATPLTLVDATGAVSSVTIEFVGTHRFLGGNGAGTQSPTPGSDMDLLNLPASASGDCMYGATPGYELVEMRIQGLDPSSEWDFTFAASRMSVTDVRTTDYTVVGTTTATATLDASQNTSDVATVAGIQPTAFGDITILVEAASSNTNSSRYYYLNALVIEEGATGQPVPPMVAVLPAFSSLTAVPTSTPRPVQVEVRSSDLLNPLVTLSVIDVATGTAPTWLSLPASAPAGSNVTMTYLPAGLAVGSYHAEVTATATGYAGATSYVDLEIVAPTPGHKLLFYGNSYSMGNQTMPDIVEFLAVEAGHDRPEVVKRLSGGKNLYFHLTDPHHASAITDALPHGEEWDYVVMQGFSTEATTVYGDPAAFRANAAAIYTNVRNHSPGARAVMFQTWARGPGHSAYLGSPPPYSGPAAMHAEIHANYQAAVDDVNALYGPDSARRAAVGDAVANEGWDLSYYTGDLSHPTAPTTLLAGSVIYTTIYEEMVSDLRPDFAGSGDLVNRMANLGLDESSWMSNAEVADRVQFRRLSSMPGPGTDLELLIRVDGYHGFSDTKSALGGSQLSLRFDSPAGDYAGVPAVVFMNFLSPGQVPVVTPGFPDLHLDLGLNVELFPWAPLGGPWVATITTPAALAAFDLRVQAFAVAPSPGNPAYTATDAHTIQFY